MQYTHTHMYLWAELEAKCMCQFLDTFLYGSPILGLLTLVVFKSSFLCGIHWNLIVFLLCVK